jgi:putative endopeptidase
MVMQSASFLPLMVFLSMFGLGSYAAAVNPPKFKPSSAIPERREFPVSPGISPCDDFYGYACSEALARFKLRDDRSSHTFAFNDSNERLLKTKESFLKDLGKPGVKRTPRTEALSVVYQACMNPKAAALEERTFLKMRAAEIESIASPESLANDWQRAGQRGDVRLFDFGDISNLDDPRSSDVYVLPELMSLPERSYYDKPDLMTDYEALLVDFFKLLGWSDPKTRAKSVVQFERDYAQVYPLPSEFRELLAKRLYISKEQVIKAYPELFLDKLLARVPDGVLLRDFSPPSMQFLAKAVAERRFDDLRNVIAWKSLSGVPDDAYPSFFKRQFAFSHKHLGGPAKRPPRGERCTSLVMSEFGREIDAELVDRLFPNFPAERIAAYGESIRAAIIKRMQTSDWLSEKTKQAGIEKVRAMKLQLVKPSNEEQWDFNLPATYDRSTPLQNSRTVTAGRREKMLRRIAKPRNPDIWAMSPLTVNAYYNPSENKFVMPIGILQYPFFDARGPDEVNLGAVGMVLGHEMGHGIDDKGAKYGKDGRLQQWMTDEEIKTFSERGRKLIEQFNAIGHNGQLTLGENMSDLSGLTFALDAAFPNGVGSVDGKKGFFLQYARTWCGTKLPKLRESLLKTDTHAMPEARVNEQVKHQGVFAEVYQCKPGDKMYLAPSDRIRIW